MCALVQVGIVQALALTQADTRMRVRRVRQTWRHVSPSNPVTNSDEAACGAMVDGT